MQCPSCKRTLQPGSAVCPVCDPSTSDGASPYSTGADDQPYGTQISFVEYAGPSTIPTSPPIEQNAGPVASEQIATPLSAPLATTPPPHRTTVSGGMITLLVVLSLLLIISASGFAYYAAIFAPADLHAQAANVTDAFLVDQAQSTAQASAQAVAKLASMTPQDLYKQTTSGTPIIDDPLTGLGGNTWFGCKLKTSDCQFVNGAYHIRRSQKGFAYNLAVGSFFKNMAFQAQVTIIKGEYGGIIFHEVSNNYYGFEIFSNGDYLFYFRSNDQPTRLSHGSSSVVNSGLNQPNLLTIIAFNHLFYLYINQQFVGRVLDSTYFYGQVGLRSGSDSGASDVAFNNAKVWGL